MIILIYLFFCIVIVLGLVVKLRKMATYVTFPFKIYMSSLVSSLGPWWASKQPTTDDKLGQSINQGQFLDKKCDRIRDINVILVI